MKTVFETSDFSEALVCKAKLEQAGLLVHMDNYNWGSAEPYLGMALGYRLWVPDDEAADAEALLMPGEAPQQEAYDPIDTCPKCSSDQVTRFRSLLWLPVFWAFGLLLATPGGNRRSCRACGHGYKTKGPALTGPMKLALLYWLVLIAFAAGAGYFLVPGLG